MTTPLKPDHEKRPFRFKLEGPFLRVSTMLLITPISPNFKGLKCSVFGRFRALQSRNIYGIIKLQTDQKPPWRRRYSRFCGCFSYIWLLFAADGVFRSHQMLEGDFFYGGESLLQDMTARVLQRRKRTVTLMARPVYDAAAALRGGSFGIGQINA